MHDKMRKMLAKKKDLSESEKKAKMDVASSLRDDMSDEMKKKMSPLKKVSVLADSQQGLEKGLAKAKQIASSVPMDDDSDMMADGGEVADPDKLQTAQDSMRKAFGYADGGLVNSESDKDLNEDHDGEMGHDQMDDPEGDEPAKYGVDDDTQEDADEEANEFHGLDMDEVNDKLQKLMKMKSKMERK